MTPEALAAIVGVFMPLLISFLKQPGWPEWAKVATAAVVSLAVGTATTAVSEGLSYGEIDAVFVSAAGCLGAATLVYKTWFKSVPLLAKLDARLTRLTLPLG